MAEKRSTTTAVSLKANKPYLLSLRALAQTRGVTIGEMVRQAIDAKFGSELEPFVIFFTQNGNQKHHSDSSIAALESGSV